MLSLLVIAGLALWLWRAVDLRELLRIIIAARLDMLALTILLPAVSNTIRALRLHVVLQNKPGLLHTVHVYNIGAMVNCLLPLRSGELSMALLLGPRLPGGKTEALSRLFVDRFLDLLAVLALFAATALLLDQTRIQAITPGRGLGYVGLGLALTVGTAWMLCFCEPLVLRLVLTLAGLLSRDPEPWVRRSTAAISGLRALFQWRIMAQALGLSLLAWTSITLNFHAGMAALFQPQGLAYSMLAVSMTVFGLMVAPMPAGIGTTHGAIILALGFFGVGAEHALAFAILYHAVSTMVSLLLGFIGLQALKLTLRPLLRGALSTSATKQELCGPS
ncbi:MAG: flippase-like domain-containing protein [Proteobacteria bacterium]|nr:flippase-like domain-containing protein [Pseudomonadota bacterium]